MIDLYNRKQFTRFLALILILTFSMISIGLPYNYAYASDITEGHPRITDNNLAPVSDTVNQAKTNAGVIIAPPSDLPAKPGKSRIEIPSRRSANSKQYLEPDGSFTVETYPKSIFYKNNQKKWVPIESDLVTSTEKSFKLKNKSNRFSSLFGDNAEVRFQENDLFLNMKPSKALPAQGVASGTKIKYSQLYKNVDMEYTGTLSLLWSR